MISLASALFFLGKHESKDLEREKRESEVERESGERGGGGVYSCYHRLETCILVIEMVHL